MPVTLLVGIGLIIFSAAWLLTLGAAAFIEHLDARRYRRAMKQLEAQREAADAEWRRKGIPISYRRAHAKHEREREQANDMYWYGADGRTWHWSGGQWVQL